jgi:hypothetical protein
MESNIVPLDLVRPKYKAENILARINYCASFLEPSCRLFSHLLEMVHVGREVVSHLHHKNSHLIPDQRVKHKSHIHKVMFVAAVAHPGWDAQKSC